MVDDRSFCLTARSYQGALSFFDRQGFDYQDRCGVTPQPMPDPMHPNIKRSLWKVINDFRSKERMEKLRLKGLVITTPFQFSSTTVEGPLLRPLSFVYALTVSRSSV